MATVTYYFNAYDSGGEEWGNNPEKMVDNLIGVNDMARTYTDGKVELLTDNTCDGTDLGTITKVELRDLHIVFGFNDGNRLYLRPIFGGGRR